MYIREKKLSFCLIFYEGSDKFKDLRARVLSSKNMFRLGDFCTYETPSWEKPADFAAPCLFHDEIKRNAPIMPRQTNVTFRHQYYFFPSNI